MENLNFGLVTVIVLILPAVLRAIPTAVIGFAGVVALRKGYPRSGVSIVVAAVLSLATHVAVTVIPYAVGPSTYGDFYIYLQGAGLIAAGLTAGGILGLVLAVPRRG